MVLLKVYIFENKKTIKKSGISAFNNSQPICRYIILITNKTIDKKSSHNPYMQDHARFFVQFLIGS